MDEHNVVSTNVSENILVLLKMCHSARQNHIVDVTEDIFFNFREETIFRKCQNVEPF